MKENLEQSNLQPRTEKKDIYEYGQIVGSHETQYDQAGKLLGEIWRNKDGREIESVEYLNDTQGRIISETWKKERKIYGRYIYQYDEKGKFLGKNWEESK